MYFTVFSLIELSVSQIYFEMILSFGLSNIVKTFLKINISKGFVKFFDTSFWYNLLPYFDSLYYIILRLSERLHWYALTVHFTILYFFVKRHILTLQFY